MAKTKMTAGRFFTVYAIYDKTEDNIIYIGSTTNLKNRIRNHMCSAYSLNKSTPVYEYIRTVCKDRKKFKEFFEFITILEGVSETDTEILETEQAMIDKYSPICNVVAAYTSEEEKIEHFKKWREENKEAINKRSKEWRNREENKEYFRNWHEKHPDWQEDWNKRHPDYQKKWREAHPNYFRDWHRAHPGYAKEHAGKSSRK